MRYNSRQEKDFTGSVLNACRPTGRAMTCDQVVQVCDVTFIAGRPPSETQTPQRCPHQGFQHGQLLGEVLCRVGRGQAGGGGGLGSTCSRLGWGTEMQGEGQSCRGCSGRGGGLGRSQGPQSPERAQGPGNQGPEGKPPFYSTLCYWVIFLLFFF